MKKLIVAMFFLSLIPLYADWNDYGITLVSTLPSGLEGAVKFELKDSQARTFYVNAPGEPDSAAMKQIIQCKNIFFSWDQVIINELSFYMYEKGIQAVVVPSSVRHNGTELKPYIPSGFTFVGKRDGMDYQYRIIVENTSLKLDGPYRGEGLMLDEMHAYIRGIREGRIIVADEKVVSGSVVVFSREKEQGERQVHPVGDLSGLAERGKQWKGGPVSTDKTTPILAARAGAIIPLGHFGDMMGPGFGGSLSYGKEGMIFRGLGAGIEGGCYYLTGKDSMDSENQKTDRGFFVPVQGYCGYRFDLPMNFSAGPFVSAGLAYLTMTYTCRDRTTFQVRERTTDDTDPVVSGGVFVRYHISGSFIVGLRCLYGLMVGAEGGMYIVTDLGVLYRL